MTVVIAGGTGFLGRALAARLAEDGHQIVFLSRGRRGASPFTPPGTSIVTWDPNGQVGSWAAALDGADAVINLAGEPIAAGRWTAARKARIYDSRVLATRSLASAIAQAKTPPAVLISASGVGYYGPHGDEVLTEDAGAGTDFLAGVCVGWEGEAQAAAVRSRVVVLRTGLVLSGDGGALPPMLPPFKFGVGGPVGSGRQYWPWIHRHDWIEMVRFAITTEAIEGPLNVTGPEPVPNATFARALGRALHRPAIMPAPAFALKLLLGEMAEGLILYGQRAVPAKAERAGFQFKYKTVEEAFKDLFKS